MKTVGPAPDKQSLECEGGLLPSGPSPFFATIRGRSLLGMLLLAFVAPVVGAGLFWPQWLEVAAAPLPDAVLGLISYGLLVVLLWNACRKAGVVYRLSPNTWPSRRQVWAYILLGIPLIAIAILGLYILYLPLSYVFPDFVVEWVLDAPPLIWWSGDPETLIASSINAIVLVIVAPVVEEVFFRGFLLSRWRQKYGVRRAVVLSSVVFAVLHIDFIGGVVFGTVLALIYIKTNSLIGPIIAHMANNGIVLLWVLVEGIVYGDISTISLDEFRMYWWLATLGAAVGVPWLVWFCRPLLRPEPSAPQPNDRN